MTTGSHYRTRDRLSLTDRQEEILRLVGRGHSNGEIAERLGMTLDGAKWHVSEIITKLGVETREEAVEAWRAQRGVGRRLGRILRGVVAPIAVHKAVAAGVAGAAVLAVAGATTFFAMQSDRRQATGITSKPLVTTPVLASNSLFVQLRMLDSNVGWALALDLTNGSTGGKGLIRTTDRGRNWYYVSPWKTTTTSFALDADHAYQVTADQDSSGSTMVTAHWTDDAGRTWRSAVIPGATSGDGSLTFVDVQHGWFIERLSQNPATWIDRMDIAIFRTADSGLTWRKVSVSGGTNAAPATDALPAECEKGVVFIDASHGFASGVCAGGLPFLFSTETGGNTWRRERLPSSADSDQIVNGCTPCFVSPPSFPTRNDGFLVVSGQITAVYVTHDAGKTWSATPSPSRASGAGLHFVDPLHGWLEDQDHLFRTEDGAKTWQLLPGGLKAMLSFVSPTEGWALQPVDNGVPPLVHTTDGGQTWQPVTP